MPPLARHRVAPYCTVSNPVAHARRRRAAPPSRTAPAHAFRAASSAIVRSEAAPSSRIPRAATRTVRENVVRGHV
ncbi:hypothetical protein EMIT0158MI4_50303 [Burkholderia ambifaria]